MVVQASFDYEVRACVMSNACVNGRAPTQQHCGTAVFSSTHVLRCCATKQSNTWRSAGRGIMARSCVGFGVAVPFPRTCPKTARADMAALEAANSLKYRAQRSESHLKIMWCIRAHRPTLSNLPIFLGRVSATTTSARVKPGSSPSAPQTNSTRGRIDSGSSDPHLASKQYLTALAHIQPETATKQGSPNRAQREARGRTARFAWGILPILMVVATCVARHLPSWPNHVAVVGRRAMPPPPASAARAGGAAQHERARRARGRPRSPRRRRRRRPGAGTPRPPARRRRRPPRPPVQHSPL
ncbi:unnamed protein product [Prorocentrum cordatum]|uniref:Uncharacterized protein n=1 Tax=Prorocentrum cordatum TaxID=2364126 RepID=A0ABN9SJZ4_9DINO|nr:unnamed protein product [Polarella glacialis]